MTPKPLTEKELEEMEKISFNLSDEYVKNVIQSAIAEIKRLRDAIGKTIKLFSALHEHPSYLDKPIGILETAIKQADEIKDGPSEEDKGTVAHMQDILDQGVEPGSRKAAHVLSKLKHYMGIE